MDLSHVFGNDLSTSHTGDLETVTGVTLSQQRILRRLLTSPGSVLFDLSYGGGVQKYIGQELTLALINEIKGVIVAQMYLEPSVSQTTPPTITLTATQASSLYCNIQYVESSTNTLQVLSFTVST